MVTVARDSRHAENRFSRGGPLRQGLCPADAHPTVTEITARLPDASYTRFRASRKCSFQLGERFIMAYVITDTCIKDSLCVDVCPTDCIHPKQDEPGFEAAKQLFVDPAECIDCGACVPACTS